MQIYKGSKLEADPAFRKLTGGIKAYINYYRPRYIMIKVISEKSRSNAMEMPPERDHFPLGREKV